MKKKGIVSRIAWLIIMIVGLLPAWGQKRKEHPVYVDGKGIMRWTATKKEAAFFGVNYTVPFAYGYRSHKALGVDLEKAIDADVYHMARLGFDAFRVHVWDTEITDSLGNLLENEHLRLFDYLLMRLKERGIKILITPLAFWGNGYPEKDQNTGSFSSIYNKQKVLVTEAAIKAQENYLQQFFRHVNPYTKTTYDADPDVIAMEINNEPHHSGPKQSVTDYINRMAAAVRSTGWTKPVFYNISESPTYADAVVRANVDGHSFQWYPTGLVANRTLQGNYLPHVDRYHIPFADTIPAFKNRTRMVYEFDAGDVLSPYMYPAMARSFRQAGFQWATQFAYDPLYTAHANTEYQTHFVNLAYTPSKAISLMIAGKAFHRLPLFKSFGSFPADTSFDAFRVSYRESLSEMNTPESFIYANTTATKPLEPSQLKQVAGVGTSAVVQYNGTGAYFLDQLEPGIWRLEVMPDALIVSDPFAKASPQKQVARLFYQEQKMKVMLPDLGGVFTIAGVNSGNEQNRPAVADGSFVVKPGVYLLVKQGKSSGRWTPNTAVGSIRLAEYQVPRVQPSSLVLTHKPGTYAEAGQSMKMVAQLAGLAPNSKVALELRWPNGMWSHLDMQPEQGLSYTVTVPADQIVTGPLEYRILVRDDKGIITSFPGGETGDPYAWDALPAATWKTMVVPAGAALPLFDPAMDRSVLSVFTSDWRSNTISYDAGTTIPFLQQVWQVKQPANNNMLGWQLYIGNKVQERAAGLRQFDKVVVQAHTTYKEARLRLVLISKDAQAYASVIGIEGAKVRNYEVLLTDFSPAPFTLLPRPYPGFQPLQFKMAKDQPLNLADVDQLQVWLESTTGRGEGEAAVMLQSIYIQ